MSTAVSMQAVGFFRVLFTCTGTVIFYMSCQFFTLISFADCGKIFQFLDAVGWVMRMATGHVNKPTAAIP